MELLGMVCNVINVELSLSVSLTVIDIVAQLIMLAALYKLKGNHALWTEYSCIGMLRLVIHCTYTCIGTDFVIKAFLYLFGCSLTVLALLLWILYAVTSCKFCRNSIYCMSKHPHVVWICMNVTVRGESSSNNLSSVYNVISFSSRLP